MTALWEVLNAMPEGRWLTSVEVGRLVGTTQNEALRLLGAAYAARKVDRRPAAPNGTPTRWEWVRE